MNEKSAPHSIAYCPIYRKLTGSLPGAILLSQLMYWAFKKTEFWKTDTELMKETGLSIKELKTAKKRIKGLDFIDISVEGFPPTTWYKVDIEKCAEKLSTIGPKGTKQKGRKGPIERSDRDQLPSPPGKVSNITPILSQQPEIAEGECVPEREKKGWKSHPRWKRNATRLFNAIASVRNRWG